VRRCRIGWLLPAVALLASAAALLVATPPGARLLVAAAERAGVLTAARVEGTLRRGLVMDHVVLASAAGELRIDELRVRARLLPLLWRLVQVRRLQASGVVLAPGAAAGAGSSPGPPALPALPVAIAIDEATIRDLRLHRGDAAAPVHIERVDLALLYGRDGRVRLDRFELAVAAGGLQADGALNAELDGELRLAWWYEAGVGEPVRGAGSLRGAGARLVLEQRMHTPLRAHLRAQVDLHEPVPAWRAQLRLPEPQTLPLPAGSTPVAVHGAGQAHGAGSVFEADAELQVEAGRYGAWQVRAAAQPEQDGALAIELQLRARDAGAAMTLGGRIDPGEAALAVTGSWQALAWPPAGAAAVTLPDGRFTLDGTVDDWRLAVQGQVAVAGLAPVRWDLRGTGSRSAFDVQHMDLRAGAGSLSGAGRLAWTPSPEVDLSGQWQGLGWPLAGEPRLRSGSGQFRLHGEADDYRLSAGFALEAPALDLPSGRVTLAAHGDRQRVRLESLVARLGDGTLHAAGTSELGGDRPFWDLDLTARALDPAWLASDWPGRIDVALRVLGEGLDAAVDLSALHGQLRGLPVQGAARASVRDRRWRVDELWLRSGASSLALNGAPDGPQGLEWRIESPDLGELWPGAGGSASGAGRVGGSLAAPRLHGRLTVHDAVLADLGAARLEAGFELDLGADGPLSATLDASGLDLGAIALEALQLRAGGRVDAHEVSLAVQGSAGEARLDARGTWRNGGWQGRLEQGRWVRPQRAPMQLVAPAALAFAGTSLDVERQCWQGDDGRVCLAAARDPAGAWTAQLGLEQVALAQLPIAKVRVQGTVDGALQAAGAGTRLEAVDGTLQLPPGRLEVEIERDYWWPLDHGGGHLELRGDRAATRARLAMRLDGPAAVPAQASIELPGLPLELAAAAALPLAGRLDARIADLAPFARLSPDLAQVDGQAEVELEIGGRAAAPRLTGRGRVRIARALVPRLGIALEDAQLELRTLGPDRYRVDGHLYSGGGRLSVAGQARLESPAQWQATVTLAGERIEVADLPEAQVFVSPDLELALQPRRIELRGVIEVPEARITPRSRADAVPVSDDVVLAGAGDEAERDPRWAVHSDVRIRLGEAVTIGAMGFSGRLTGEVRARDEPGQATIGTGELRIVDGRFEAYGQRLDLDRGRIVFAGGPIDDPGVDANAVRRVGSVTVGVRARGRLREPVLDLFSSPSMPDNEILSYLILGQPFGEGSAADGRVLVNAAASLGLAQGELLSQRIARAFSLDELSVSGSPADEQMQLNVGKYLSPKLYVGYGMGLLEPSSTVRLRYDLNPRWSVEAETGSKTAADVLYNIER